MMNKDDLKSFLKKWEKASKTLTEVIADGGN